MTLEAHTIKITIIIHTLLTWVPYLALYPHPRIARSQYLTSTLKDWLLRRNQPSRQDRLAGYFPLQVQVPYISPDIICLK